MLGNSMFTFKLITAGEGAVGKTTLIHRYVEGKFNIDTKMTIGVEIFHKEVKYNGQNCSLQLWDFGGQERFRFFLDSFVKGADGAFLMFDLTRPETLLKLENWFQIIRKDNPALPVVLLGSKLDLEDAFSIDEESVREFMDNNNISDYLKVSSKTGINVEESFQVIVKLMIDNAQKVYLKTIT